MLPFASTMLHSNNQSFLTVDYSTPWTGLYSQTKPEGYRFLTVEILGSGAPGWAEQDDGNGDGVADWAYSGAGGTFARSHEVDVSSYSTFDVVVAGRSTAPESVGSSYVRLGTSTANYILLVSGCSNHDNTPYLFSAFGTPPVIIRGEVGQYTTINPASTEKKLTGGAAAQGGSLVSIAGEARSISGPLDPMNGFNFGGGGAKYMYAGGSEGSSGYGGQAFVRMIWRKE